MKVTLIMPGVGRKPGAPYPRSWLMEPLALAALAGATPPEVEVQLVDDRLEAIPYDQPPDAVGLNVETYTARRAYAIAARYRRRGVPVILGGYHPTLVPEEAARHADAIVEGPAEAVWPEVMRALEYRCLRPRYAGSGDAPGAMVPGPRARRSLFAGRKYLPITLIETGRGCRFGCEFCSVAQFYRHSAVGRPIEDVLGAIEAAGRRDVFFVDDNIVADPERAKRLFAALTPARVRWVSQGSLTMADDPGLLAAMRRSGCEGVLIGFESLSAATLAAMGKSWNRTRREYDEAVRRLRDAGLAIYATFVFGYDTDDADAFARTLEFALRQRFCMAAFNHLVPFPGTPLYARLQREGRLRRERWWLEPSYRFGDVAFHPRQMSADELAQRCYDARHAFYRFGSVFQRAWDRRANCRDLRSAARYLWVNLFSGREMRQRQGLPLGEGFDDEACHDADPTRSKTMDAGEPGRAGA